MSFFGIVFSFPQLVLFFVVWILASLWRPFVGVSCVLAVINKPSAVVRKLLLLWNTANYMIFCNDKKWKKPKIDPDSYFKDVVFTSTAEDENKKETGVVVERKTVLFVRHGESTWNDTFNPGDRPKLSFLLNFVPGVFKALAYEWYYFVMGLEQESWFYDSPLSDKGVSQAKGIQIYLQNNLEFMTPKEAAMMKILLGKEDDEDKMSKASSSSQLVSSNLRRAISTMVIGFQDRLANNSKQETDDSIIILSELQEISRNPDALSITPKGDHVQPTWSDPKSLHVYYNTKKQSSSTSSSMIDVRLNTGNKPVKTNGLKRMQAFCDLVFEKLPAHKKHVIAAGHSLWFRSFFQTYLPHSFEHVCKKKKLINGGIVGFVLERVRIDNADTTSTPSSSGGTDSLESTPKSKNSAAPADTATDPPAAQQQGNEGSNTNNETAAPPNSADPATPKPDDSTSSTDATANDDAASKQTKKDLATTASSTSGSDKEKQQQQQWAYRIDPNSLVVLYGGF